MSMKHPKYLEKGNTYNMLTVIKTDNRKCNLRICTIAENSRNQTLAINNTSGVVGVRFNKNVNKWTARLYINKKRMFLGYFVSKEDAIKARKDGEEKYYGEFSYDNSMKIADKGA